MENKIWLSAPHMGGNEQKYIKEAFDQNWIAPIGPNINEFEKELSKIHLNHHVAALASGTSAIHLALILAGVKTDDEVLCQTFTFSASANPILYQNAIPIFIDSENETWNMDPALLEIAIKDRISKGKKPKACIVVHLYGMPAKINEIAEICKNYGIKLIEDAAEALGSTLNKQPMGTFGDYSILSFNGNKIITTSGGGALIAKDLQKIEKAKFLSTQARDPAPHYQHSELGYNYRMSNICAGIGRGQLEVLDLRVAQRRANYEFYKKHLKLKDDQKEMPGGQSNRWLSTFIFKNKEDIRLKLEEENIESRPLWKPMHLQPIFKIYPNYLNGVSEKLFENGLCLPSSSNLKEVELTKICSIIHRTTK